MFYQNDKFSTHFHLLIRIDWDDFYFLICSTDENIERLTRSLGFDGFFATLTPKFPGKLQIKNYRLVTKLKIVNPTIQKQIRFSNTGDGGNFGRAINLSLISFVFPQ
jgi:hypothetical protein